MSQRASLPHRGPLVLFSFLVGIACPVAANATGRVSESYGKLPLHFEANQGQTHEDVRYLSRGPGYSLYLTAGEAVLVLTQPNAGAKPAQPEAKAQAKSAVLRMGLVGAARKPLVSALEELPGKANYFVGKDPSKWRTNVPTYAKVHYREVYPGIDLVYYGNQRQLEYDFIVAPGADPKKIVLGFKGAERIEIDAEGDLVLHAAGGTIRQKKPVIYQEIDGVRQEVAGSYVRRGAKRVGFKVAAYDASRPLIIDPVLAYSTYLGGSGQDWGLGIAVDIDGNAYVTGFTTSIDFPTSVGAFQPVPGYAGDRCIGAVGISACPGDAFVTKLNPTGSALVYSTYLGGVSREVDFVPVGGIAVDAAGSAYVTGHTTSSNFPITPGAFQLTPSDGGDAFVTKLDPTGSALVYSTYLGGSGKEHGFHIAVDTNGNAYVTGDTVSIDFPTTGGAFRTALSGGQDVFVTKLNLNGSGLIYSTYLGGGSDSHLGETGRGIAVDATGSAYVTGTTSSNSFPTTEGAFQTACPATVSTFEAFITKLDATGSALVYSTCLGGGGDDLAHAIAVDAAGNAYVTGTTRSTNFPTTAGAFQTIIGGGGGDCSGSIPPTPCHDAFVTKINPTGTALVYSTFLGGTDIEVGTGIAVDAAGNAFVTGRTKSFDFPTTPGGFQFGQVFVTKLEPTGSALVYSTFFGGNGAETGRGIALDVAGNAYVTGVTDSAHFPTTPGAFQPEIGGGSQGSSGVFGGDAFVAKIVE